MKNFFAVALFTGLIAPAPAALVITEINSEAAPADFWELTNTGTTSMSLAGWVWDDSSANPADPEAVTIGAGVSIASGESIVFAVTADAAAFRSAWGGLAGIQVIVTGGTNPGLGADDAINLFNPQGALQASLSYAAGGFTLSSGGPSLGGDAGTSAGAPKKSQSLIIDPTFGTSSPRYTFADGANFGSFTSTGGKFGSPGVSGLSVVPEPGTVALLTLGLGLSLHGIRRSRHRR